MIISCSTPGVLVIVESMLTLQAKHWELDSYSCVHARHMREA